MPFARWKTFNECKLEQMQIGHDEQSAKNICGAIQERAEKGVLFKSLSSLEILKSADNELVVGGLASWEMVDYENDVVTTEAQVNFLRKFFALPEEYRNVTIDHSNFQIAKALLQYPEENPEWFSHVHEKGMWLIAKIRNDDLTHTRHYRKLIRDGTYKMFSISGKPIKCDGPCEKHLRINKIRKIFDIDPVEVGIVKEGMVSKANFKILKTKCPPCVEHLRDKLMLKGLPEGEATDRAIKLFNRVHARMEKEKMQKVKKELSIEELKQKIVGLEAKRTKLYRSQDVLHQEEHTKNEDELAMLNAKLIALQELLTEKLKVKIEAEAIIEKKKGIPVSAYFESEVATVYNESARKALPDLNLPKRETPKTSSTPEERIESFNLASEAEKILKKQFPEYKKEKS